MLIVLLKEQKTRLKASGLKCLGDLEDLFELNEERDT